MLHNRKANSYIDELIAELGMGSGISVERLFDKDEIFITPTV